MAIVFGIVLSEICADRVQIGNRLRRSDAWLQMSHYHKYPTVSARIQEVRTLYLLLVNHWHKEIGRAEQQSPVEPEWSYTEDGKRVFVDPDNAAHHVRIILKMHVPIRVCENHIRSAVWPVLIGAVEETAKIGLNAQCVEVVSTYFLGPRGSCILAGVQARLRDGESCQTVKAAITIAQIEIVRIRLRRIQEACSTLDCIKALRLRHIQRTQYQRVQYAKN